MLYKQEKDKYIPFYFPVAAEYNFNASTEDPGAGGLDFKKPFGSNAAVIKSFNVKFMGTNLFEAGRGSIQATLTIEVDTLSSIFDAPQGFAPLADLFVMKNSKSGTISGQAKAQSSPRINTSRQVPIGAMLKYSTPKNSDLFSKDELTIINNMGVFTSLYYAGHNLSIVGPEARASITIEYHGHLHATKHDMVYDLFAKPEQKAAAIRLGSQATRAPQNINTPPGLSAGSTAVTNKGVRQFLVQDRMKPMLDIIESLYQRKKVYSLNVSPENLTKYYGLNTFFDADAAAAEADDVISTSDSAITINSVAKRTLNDYRVHYITVADFVDAYFYAQIQEQAKIKTELNQQLEKKEIDESAFNAAMLQAQTAENNLKRFAIIFGDISYTSPGKEPVTYEGQKKFNVGDIPIAVDTLYTVFYEEYIKPQKQVFGPEEFLKTFLLKLIAQSFNPLQKASFINKVHIEIYQHISQQLESDANGLMDVGQLSKNKIVDPAVKPPTKEYLVYHQLAGSASKTLSSGKKRIDIAEGIHHLRMNQDRGLLKEITFSQMDIPLKAEYHTIGAGMMFDELRVPQQASVSMYGNTIFLPNSLVYLDPDTLGFGDPRLLDSAARKLGIGGYYTVITSNLSFTDGVLATSLDLSWWGWPESNSQTKLTSEQIRAVKDNQALMNRAKSWR